MAKLIQTIRKAALVMGCAAVLLALINAVIFASSQLKYEYSLGREFTVYTLSSAVISPLLQFIWYSCLALILILIAAAIDPAKIKPVFNLPLKSDQPCESDPPANEEDG